MVGWRLRRRTVGGAGGGSANNEVCSITASFVVLLEVAALDAREGGRRRAGQTNMTSCSPRPVTTVAFLVADSGSGPGVRPLSRSVSVRISARSLSAFSARKATKQHG